MPLKTPNYLEEPTYSPEDRPVIQYKVPPLSNDIAGFDQTATGTQPGLDMISPVPGGAPTEPVLTPAIPRPTPQPIPGAVPQPMQPQVAQPPPEDTLVSLRKQLLDFERVAAEPRPKKLRPVPLGLSALMLAVDAYTGKPRWLNMLLFDRPAKQRKLDTQYAQQLDDWNRKKPLYDTHKAILEAQAQQEESKARVVAKSSAERSYISAKIGLENIKAGRKNAATQYANRLEEAEAAYQRNIQDGADEKMSRGKADMARMTAVNDYTLALDKIGYINESKYQEIINKARARLKELGVDPITIDVELMPDIKKPQSNDLRPQGGAEIQQGDDYSTLSDDELISSLNRELGSEVA